MTMARHEASAGSLLYSVCREHQPDNPNYFLMAAPSFSFPGFLPFQRRSLCTLTPFHLKILPTRMCGAWLLNGLRGYLRRADLITLPFS